MRFGKLLAAIVGVPMVIAGLAMTVVGGVALAVPNDDGWVSAGPLRMRTEAVGFVGEDLHMDLGHNVADSRTFIGWDVIPARVDVSSKNGKDIFVGIASTADARAYLAGVAVDRVESLHDEHDILQVDGALSIAPPDTQDFWLATNGDGEVEWSLADGDWSVVVLNSDGTAGVDVAVTGSARIPFLSVIGGALIALGLIASIVGSLLTYYGVRESRSRPAFPAAPSPPQSVAVG